ncbi:ThiF family adenylyltransferase [Streptomyces mobaraensis NBRC 13819 = DSM 40847]|uniref:UBA/THIF-type NAD/FAD binding protein n=1 Tax=Streptomyces mobaraensis (strain ATCC 29032 / DSM 40847 / JCM 4168 / NBRC 13819 / NCIMB 11159 / IPCR 16-22) TaxID=1223523 RepID=M3BS98_STRM1|nr:ThiF family adenylyltransferase [Streptomyces mobaraensis]EMF02570.1 UBA/THIF-type NAD/FAD binding protein [Streptomyces mobaraensis NBRC 13819 = DSM 40847]QTT75608.1 ThiF family adenylyltransferase [Streptomyces mobaraensis NBRC 13819 = DSM 40847]
MVGTDGGCGAAVLESLKDRGRTDGPGDAVVGGAGGAAGAHPVVKPALRRAWRRRDVLQLGMTRAHARVVGPVDTATASFLGLLDGTRGLPLLRAEAAAMGLPEGRADALVERLTRAGVLDDARGGGRGGAALRSRGPALERLRPDLASLSVLHPAPGAALGLMAARQARRVQVRGAGRVGAAVAALLSASGVGQVDVLDGGYVEPWDVSPCGVGVERTGERRDAAARRVVREAAPLPRPRTRAREDEAGAGEFAPPLALTVFAPRDGVAVWAPDPAGAREAMAAGAPHLYAGVAEATGVVGPLVLPGRSACAECLALGRAERDAAWPRMVAQWKSGRRAEVPSCDMALATVVAGLTVSWALAFLDGGSAAGVGARLELALPGPDWSSRPVEPHPRCPCGAARSPEGGRARAAGAPHGTMPG